MQEQRDVDSGLQHRLAGARFIAVVGIGDELQPPDRLGMVAAREIEKLQLHGVRVFLAGTVPETVVGPLRRFGPDHVLMIDSADMGVPPGTVGIIEPGQIQARSFSTHALPLSIVMEYIEKNLHTGVTLVGIQPENDASSCRELSEQEQSGIARLLAELTHIVPENT